MNRITGTHRLLDGYAEPSRVRRLKDHQQRQQAGRRRRDVLGGLIHEYECAI
jgi:hypothetical protein